MNTTVSELPPAQLNSPASSMEKSHWLNQARHACQRIPPLWPLHSFVAVNPFVGLVGKPFAEVCSLMQQVTHESMLMSADYFRQQYENGRITPQDLMEAIDLHQESLTTTDLLAWLKEPEVSTLSEIQCLTDFTKESFGQNLSSTVTEEISKWCAAYFDEGQSAWRMPWKKQPFYSAWRSAAQIDATPELQGFRGFRTFVKALPDNAPDALVTMLISLKLHPDQSVNYLHHLLMTLPGWSSYVQYRVRERTLHGQHDESLLELLTIRLVFEAYLAEQYKGDGLLERWHQSTSAPFSENLGLQKQLLWHTALEAGFQRELATKIAGASKTIVGEQKAHPSVQAVFCIDVRSEIMRRSLESVSPEIETLGFAGFFGMPIEYVPLGKRRGSSQVPVLLSPKYRVREHLPHVTPQDEKNTRWKMQVGRRVSHSWNAFKTSAVSCFSFVEAAGISFAWKLLKDSFQMGEPSQPHSCSSCAAPNLHEQKRRFSSPADDTYPESGIPLEDQATFAHGALKNMGLTDHFARLVMLCGHGSNTTNNPYAAGLDCGACGGHTGEANARVAAMILNQPNVRVRLANEGISIPSTTQFIAALHDTTTDEIHLFDKDKLPSSHETDLLQLQLWLDKGSKRCRLQRAASLGIHPSDYEDLEKVIHQRSGDWSQVRPEWGLAGNAAFVAAPRQRTQILDLQGRVFLHNYHYLKDTDQSTLELIMTAPMVVANWINLQYYASTVNNRLWGSGNKVTHNVVGTFGIQQGNGGDLQAGLPLQSLHNGQTWMHEPMRLSVFLEAPRDQIDAIISKHETVRDLAENGWLHLFAIEDEGAVIFRRKESGRWQMLVN